MMKTIIAVLCALGTVGASPALALSCLPQTVGNAYHDARDSKAAYQPVYGVLSFDEALLPRVDMANQAATPQETLIHGRMTGYALTDQGFDAPFDQVVTLDVRCFGPWCGGAKSGVPYLGFLEKRADGMILEVTPCGGFGFAEPSQEVLRQVITCHRGGRCDRIGPPQ